MNDEVALYSSADRQLETCASKQRKIFFSSDETERKRAENSAIHIANMFLMVAPLFPAREGY